MLTMPKSPLCILNYTRRVQPLHHQLVTMQSLIVPVLALLVGPV